MENLKYASTEQYHEGIVIEVTDGSVTIDFKGRLGTLKVPRRMVITDWPITPGMEVGFLMSYPEVLREAPREPFEHPNTPKEDQHSCN